MPKFDYKTVVAKYKDSNKYAAWQVDLTSDPKLRIVDIILVIGPQNEKNWDKAVAIAEILNS